MKLHNLLLYLCYCTSNGFWNLPVRILSIFRHCFKFYIDSRIT